MWGNAAATPLGGYTPDPLGQFLSTVVPWGTAQTPGFINIHAFGGTMRMPPKGGGRAYAGLHEYSQLRQRVDYLNRMGSQVFFCLSLQGKIDQVDQHGNRRAARDAGDALQLRSFVLDLDVKATGYPSQRAALAALLTFCDDLGLELGYVVSSGGGIHAYFTLDAPIDRATWRPLASQLKAAATAKGLKFDSNVTVNPAQILRLPCSTNYKDPQNPRLCSILQVGVLTTLAAFSEALKLFPPSVPVTSGVTSNGRLSPLDPTIFPPRAPIVGAEAERVRQEIERARVATSHHLLYKACPVFASSYDRGGDGDPEPLWFALAKLCHYVEQGRDLFHDLSSGDQRYDEELTEQKYDTVQREGWPQCRAISDSSAGAAAICRGCKHVGQGGSPINYAIRGLDGTTGAPIVLPSAGGGLTSPPMTAYVNGVNGTPGVFGPSNNPAGYSPILMPPGYSQRPDLFIMRDEDNVQVFDTAVYDLELVSARTLDGTFEHQIKVSVGRGVGGGIDRNDIQFGMGSLTSGRSLMEATFKYGLVCNDAIIARRFLLDWQTTIRSLGGASNYDRMGWTEANNDPYGGFTYGGSTFTRSGTVPSGTSKAIEQRYTPRGSLEIWKKAASHLVGHGMIELEALIAASFAAPLITFTPEDGAVVFGKSSQSGVGKTAALVVNASVWGSRTSVMQTLDTSNAIYSRAANLYNLPLIMDEMVPNPQASKNFTEIVMAISGGKEKSRLDRSANDKPFRTWRTLMVAASNHSLIEQASSNDSNAQAVRVFEFDVPNRFKGSGLARSDITLIRQQLEDNYGTAGLVYAEFLGRNGSSIAKLVADFMDEFQQRLYTRDDERFWVAVSATIIAGASIAKKLGLLPFDLEGLWEFLAGNIRKQRTIVKDMGVNVEDPTTHIGRLVQFMNENVRHQIHTDTMAVQGANRFTTKMQVLNAGQLEHANFFVARIAKADRKMFISFDCLKDWCKDRGYNFRHMVSVLQRDKLCTKSANKRSLGAQANLMTTPAAEFVLEFDLANPDLQVFLP